MSSELSDIFITREMLIREPGMALFEETKRRAAAGLCAYCGMDWSLLDLAGKAEHYETCRIRAWAVPSKKS